MIHPGCATGVYNIMGKDEISTFEAYCDMDAEQGPWMLILAYVQVGKTPNEGLHHGIK